MGKDGNLHMSELLPAGPVLTEVSPPGSNAEKVQGLVVQV